MGSLEAEKAVHYNDWPNAQGVCWLASRYQSRSSRFFSSTSITKKDPLLNWQLRGASRLTLLGHCFVQDLVLGT